MVLGKQGLRLEAAKFGVYLFIPIVASIGFNSPAVQEYWADYFQFLKFPANPNTRLKEEFEELAKKRALEKEQRREYADQIRKLQESAQRSRAQQQASEEASEKKKGWLW